MLVTGALTHINGIPIKLVKPFHVLSIAPDGVFTLWQAPVVTQQLSTENYIKELS